MQTAVAIIREEHRSFVAVLHGLLYLTREIRARRLDPDFALFDAIHRYIEAFPEKLHHPKEDAYVYARLREQCAEAEGIIAELEAEHVQGRVLIANLAAALDRYRRDGAAAFTAFDREVATYTDFHWTHMRKEEDVALPLAEAALTADDWQAIDAAFASNDDPLVGVTATRESHALFRRIVNPAPPPIGVGPSHA
ncbi:MAG: hemerythrin domain-containing protein [Betaproteobacteria bacterium]